MTVTIIAAVLEQARAFFEERGSIGCEGTAMISATDDGVAAKLVIPDQRAGAVPCCWVEVTRAGKSELAAALGPHDRYVARIHSHPGLAFHSPTDDANPAITYPGAISIVVPYFGLGLRHGLDACAVFVRRDDRWDEVPPGVDRRQLVVTR
jgi:hypothetical protein